MNSNTPETPDSSKHTVFITSLAMRFYSHNGWTHDELAKYLTRGGMVEKGSHHPPHDHYWILEVNSALDVDRMFADGVVGEVRCKDEYGETKNLSDIEAMKLRNW